MEYKLTAPLSKADAAKLRAGDTVLLSGTIYTARDAAHKRLCALAAEGKPLPFAIEDAVVYYAGPTPARPGGVIGSAGPTTSYRMDAYAPTLLRHGPDGHDRQRRAGAGGRGGHAPERAPYTLAAIGGAGAAIAACVSRARSLFAGRTWAARRCAACDVRRYAADGRHRQPGRKPVRERPGGLPGKPAGTLNSNRSGPRRILFQNAARPACTAHAQNGSSPRR